MLSLLLCGVVGVVVVAGVVDDGVGVMCVCLQFLVVGVIGIVLVIVLVIDVVMLVGAVAVYVLLLLMMLWSLCLL